MTGSSTISASPCIIPHTARGWRLSLPANPEDAKKEAAEVSLLLDQLRALGATDTKRDRFFDRIRDLSAEGRPVLIFTEYADTMEYLRDNLANHYGAQVASLYGGMDLRANY